MKRALVIPFVAATLAWSAPKMPAPAGPDYARGAREARNASCVACHPSVASEHDRSLHAVAFSDAAFQKGYAKEQDAFCRSCHAPEAKPDAEPDSFAKTRGVACVTCHVPDEGRGVVTGDAHPTSNAPHAVTRVSGFATSACAKCHEFSFPHAESLGAKGLMQKTMTEHAASPAKDRACGSCHMPKGSHAFIASRDDKLLARALDVTATRRGDEVTLLLRAKDVGHAFPTGDLFRRLLVRMKTPRGTFERPLGRAFAAERDDGGNSVRYEIADQRLVSEQRVSVTTREPVTWSVLYQRVTFVSQIPPFEATVEDEKVIAKGVVP